MEKNEIKNGSIETIGTIKLKNQGGFVVSLECHHKTSELAKPSRKGSTGNFPLGQSREIDLSTLDIKDGDMVTAFANVVLGKDNHSNVWFAYKKGDHRTAKFTISGTTLDNELGFNGIE